ncbi:DUF222 domain-containing protein [Demequina sp. SYSU T00039]|uniref:DUF222 domain-containing protein n=1 Tax=Demequina lignilytica TaxID=3051663 RepID=A0AAW7M7Q4_9MICO|nr:HNH endonuclease signature motif containing protein [Demequina sp. SYSU T00039]MDN4486697.1 DUF222 domain-containing protein [Demequina sp. SYSU T00039]
MAPTTGTETLAQLRARAESADGLTDPEIEAFMERMVDHRREVDVILALLACHVKKRSAARSGAARRRGFQTSAQMTAAKIGGTVAEAQRLEDMGEVLLGAQEGDDAGEQHGGKPDDAGAQNEGQEQATSKQKATGPTFPYLAQAVRGRRVGPDAGALIRSLLLRHPDAREASGLQVDPGLRETRLGKLPLAAVERATVDKCAGLPLRSVRSLIARLEADLTPPPEAERDYEELRRRRFVTVREDRDGMVQVHALLDPLTAAPLLASMRGYVKGAMRRNQDDRGVDDRTPEQMRADALGWLGRHATSCRAPHDGIKTTVNIRMTLEQLQRATGHGTVDGISRPIPAAVLRREAADACAIPTVLGGRSEILDHGSAERLFTRPQRRALIERDGGCAWCQAPPDFCDAHHLTYWRNGGRTDLDNGIMLCVGCHTWIHRDGWQIRMVDGRPWFIPPADVDPARRPRPGGRHASTMSDEDVAAALAAVA